MRANGSRSREGIGLMQQTRTWVMLYVLGIGLLVFSLWWSEEGKPAGTPKPPASLSQRGAAGAPIDGP